MSDSGEDKSDVVPIARPRTEEAGAEALVLVAPTRNCLSQCRFPCSRKAVDPHDRSTFRDVELLQRVVNMYGSVRFDPMIDAGKDFDAR